MSLYFNNDAETYIQALKLDIGFLEITNAFTIVQIKIQGKNDGVNAQDKRLLMCLCLYKDILKKKRV